MKWFTADLHLSHANIIHHCNRPFNGPKEMDDTLIANINESVKEKDELYILGDIGFANPCDLKNYLKQIKCKNLYLIAGNHDKHVTQLQDIRAMFQWIMNYYELKVGFQKIVLFHYPITSWNGRYHGAWHLYGHVHGNNVPTIPYSFSYDVGVDNTNFKPVSFDMLKEMADKMAKEKEEVYNNGYGSRELDSGHSPGGRDSRGDSGGGKVHIGDFPGTNTDIPFGGAAPAVEITNIGPEQQSNNSAVQCGESPVGREEDSGIGIDAEDEVRGGFE